MQTMLPEADTELVGALEQVIADPPAVLVIHTGGGIRRILETAASIGLEASLRDT